MVNLGSVISQVDSYAFVTLLHIVISLLHQMSLSRKYRVVCILENLIRTFKSHSPLVVTNVIVFSEDFGNTASPWLSSLSLHKCFACCYYKNPFRYQSLKERSILGKKHSRRSPLNMMLIAGFLWMSFNRLMEFLFFLQFVECFYYESVLDFVKCLFVCMYWDNLNVKVNYDNNGVYSIE